VAPREENNNRGFTFDGGNLGSVNPESGNTGRGDITPQKNTVDENQGELYENPSLSASPLPPAPDTYNKIGVYTYNTHTPTLGTGGDGDGSGGGVGYRELGVTPSSVSGGSGYRAHNILGSHEMDLTRLLSSGRDTKVRQTRLGDTLDNFVVETAREMGVSVSECLRRMVAALYFGRNFAGLDMKQALSYGFTPHTIIPVNLNVVNNNNNVNVGAKRYEREIEEPKLKARFRALAEEVMKGPPKEKKWDPMRFEDVWVDPSPEKVAKWLAEKWDTLAALGKRMDRLKTQLSPEEEELLKEVRKKLASMGG